MMGAPRFYDFGGGRRRGDGVMWWDLICRGRRESGEEKEGRGGGQARGSF